MSKTIFLNGATYIASKEAGKHVGYSYDYVSRLARDGVIEGEKVGTNWFVKQDALEKFAAAQKANRSLRGKQMTVASPGGGMSSANKRDFSAGFARRETSLSSYAKQSVAEVVAKSSSNFKSRTASLANMRSHLNGAKPQVDNSLRMQSIAQGGTMRAFGGGGMMARSLSPSVGGFSGMAMANRVVALLTATSFVFGLYSFTDPHYATYVKDTLEEGLAVATEVMRDVPQRGLAAADNFSTGFSQLTTDPTSYVASSAQSFGLQTNATLRAWSGRLNAFTDSAFALVGDTFQDMTTPILSNVFGKTYVRIGVRELPLIESELRAKIASAGTVQAQDTTHPVREKVPTVINNIVQKIETRQETVREVVPIEILQSMVDSAINTDVIENSLRSELLGVVNSSLSTRQVSNVGALSLSQRIDQLSGVDISGSTISGGTITNASISGSSGSFTDLTVSGAVSLAALTINDLTLSGDLSVAGVTTLSTTTITDITATEATFTNATSTTLSATDATFTTITSAGTTTLATTTASAFSAATGVFSGTLSALSAAITNTITATLGSFTDLRVTNTATTTDLIATNSATLATTTASGLITGSGGFTISAGDVSLPVDTIESSEITNATIDEVDLDTSVNASLDLADSALQSGDNISELTNDSGFITSADDTVSGTELDGVFSTAGLLLRTGAATYSTVTNNTTNWNTAFGWGDHALGGYLTTVDISDNTNLVAGTGITLTGDTLSVDLGTSIDISDETNLTGDTEIVLTGDALSIAASIARDTELHDAVTLGGTLDYITLVGQVLTRNAIDLTTDVSGTLPIANGGTGATTLNDLITLGTHTTGNYLATLASGTGITITGSGSESAAASAALNTAASVAFTGDYDFGGGTLQLPNSDTLPVTCEVGDIYFDTDATSGQRVYGCESADTWALQGGSGGSSLLTDGGTTTYLTATTDDFALGGTDAEAPLFFDVSAAALTLNPFGASTGNTGELRLEELEANGDNYVGFKAPDTLTSNLIFTLPSADGTDGQVLKTDGSGNLSWVDASSAGLTAGDVDTSIDTFINAMQHASSTAGYIALVNGVADSFGSATTANLASINQASSTAISTSTNGVITPSFLGATGGTITDNGSKKVHTFTTSGTFTPYEAGDVEYLVVAGGGGGGTGYNSGAGGGGAGGFNTGTGHAVTVQGYSVTVGAGGSAGSNGSDSVFDTVTSTGGGAGGNSGVGNVGGSGGGGSCTQFGDLSGGAGTGSEGNAGGTCYTNGANYWNGGGGGGASAVGSNGANSVGPAGNGGAGTASSISGSAVTYAGGGGGRGSGTDGSGGIGGGGDALQNGTANTGGGGGGQSAGGSGIVIISYTPTEVDNISLLSNTFTADAAPDTAMFLLAATSSEAFTLNTDIIASVSRDGGTTWTAATLTALGSTLEDGTQLYGDTAIDISAQPSGTAMQYKIVTANNKAIDLHSIGFRWGDVSAETAGSLAVSGALSSASLTIASSTPASPVNTLYNLAGSLYWNGQQVGVGNSYLTNHTFTTGETWSALSSLTAAQTLPLWIDTTDMTEGRIDVIVDGVTVEQLGSGSATTRVVSPSSSLSIQSVAEGFDVNTTDFVDSFSVSGQEATPTGTAFNTDGTKMFVVGQSGVDVNEYTLSTGFDVSTASFVDAFSVSGQEATPQGLAFNADGTKMFVTGSTGDDVNEYTLSTGFDVSTASFVDAFSVSGQETNPQDVEFSTDGTKMFVIGSAGDDINEYTLSTGFDVSTASFVDAFSVAGEESAPHGMSFNADGTKVFVTGETGDDINEYALSSAFDISTASFTDVFSVSDQETEPRDVEFNADGTKMFVVGNTGDDINEYTLKTGFDIVTTDFVDSFDVSGEDGNSGDIAFNPDGTKMFVVGYDGDDINEYTLGTGFDVSTASFVDSFSVSANIVSPVGIAFNVSGTKMFVVDFDGEEDVNEYTLSTGFDVSTASFVDSFDVSAQDVDPYGLTFNTDGTKMFLVGRAGDDVNEYTLSTGFDVSTASFVDSFSVAGQDTEPRDVSFNTDGTKMFVTGNTGDDINEYTLSTGFDVSTASFVDSFSVAGQDTVPVGLAFNTAGTKMFVVGAAGDDINEYTLTSAFSGSTYAAIGEVGGGGSTLFTDGGAATYLTSLTDDFAIGGSSIAAPFYFDESAELLTLTNTTSGLSFRVNDAASDTTPFVIDASGNVGIGTASPSAKLHIVDGNLVLAGQGGGGLNSSTMLLLHGDGSDASTTFTDSSTDGADSPHTATARSDAQLDTADKKFGTGSILFDGTGDDFDLPDSADWDFGSGDFTIDFWVNHSTSGNEEWYFVQGDTGSSDYSFSAYKTTANKLSFGLSSNGTRGSMFDQTSSESIPTGQWVHIALVRNGSNVYGFIDGQQVTWTTTVSGTVNNSAQLLYFGDEANRNLNFFNGHLDEARITKGEAIWTANFTPPTVAYSVAGTDAGYIGLGVTSPEFPIEHSSGAKLTAGGSWTNASSRDLKENFTSLSSEDVLSGINGLDITRWNYIVEDDSILHVGPIAQDFYETFGLGGSERSISTIDSAGVALVGVQALSERWEGLAGMLNFSLDDLTATTTEETTTGGIFGGLVDTIISAVMDRFEELGVALSETVASFSNLATAALTVGSTETPSGITIYDKETNEAYCLEMSSGEMVSTLGTCEELAEQEELLALPTITLIGNNPAEIALNASFSDLGATATITNEDGQSVDTTVYRFFNGAPIENVALDTATSSVQYIDYVAVNGEAYATSTRVVLIGEALEEYATSTLEMLLESRELPDWEAYLATIPAYGQAVSATEDTDTSEEEDTEEESEETETTTEEVIEEVIETESEEIVEEETVPTTEEAVTPEEETIVEETTEEGVATTTEEVVLPVEEEVSEEVEEEFIVEEEISTSTEEATGE